MFKREKAETGLINARSQAVNDFPAFIPIATERKEGHHLRIGIDLMKELNIVILPIADNEALGLCDHVDSPTKSDRRYP